MNWNANCFEARINYTVKIAFTVRVLLSGGKKNDFVHQHCLYNNFTWQRLIQTIDIKDARYYYNLTMNCQKTTTQH